MHLSPLARRDTVAAALVLALGAAVLLLAVEQHALWDPVELDAAQGARPRLVQAAIGCAILLLVARGASLVGGRRAAVLAACVVVAMPAIGLRGRLVAASLAPALAASLTVVGAIGARLPGRGRGRALDLALMSAGAVGLGWLDAPIGPPTAALVALVAPPPNGRTAHAACVSILAAGLALAVAHAGAGGLAGNPPDAPWAQALEPAVYGALPWAAVVPLAALAALGRARRHRACAAIVTWLALDPWLGDGRSGFVPAAILVGVALTRPTPALRRGGLLAVAGAAVIALDVWRSFDGIVEAAAAPIALPDGPGAWRGMGALGLLFAALAWAAVRGRGVGIGAARLSALAGLAIAHGLTPALSAQLGHGDLLAALPGGAPLAVIGVSEGRAARWRPDGPTPSRLASPAALAAFLDAPEPRYAVAPRAERCAIRAAAAGRALHVPGADARLLLLSNRPGPSDRDPLRGVIFAGPPAPRPLARLAQVDVLHFEAPRSVRRGAEVAAALHLRVRAPIGRDLRVFVHVDGPGARVQADHDPVNGVCPTSRWLPGDRVIDRFRFDAGGLAHPPGRYAIWVGLFHGSPGRWQNMPVLDGPRDAHDRVHVGDLELR